jgi:uncharacterized membrane protein
MVTGERDDKVPGEEKGRHEPGAHRGENQEPVWTFRGYQMRPSEFNTAMVHFFRAEVQRANVWRQRLDTTTNWAVVTTGATMSFAFSQMIPHSVIILNTLLVTLFLFIEARRYRYYELWSYRVRLMETDFFAGMLVPPFRPSPDWAESLAENLLHPQFPISMWEALGRRFRRDYAWVYIILSLAWLLKVYLHPIPISSWSDFVTRASIGNIPGWLVLAMGLTFNVVLMLIGLLTVGLQEATGEVLPRYDTFRLPGVPTTSPNLGQRLGRWRAWFRPSHRRQQLLALIITNQAEAVSQGILGEMTRGVTALPATGMYTGQPRSVLMCALTVTEVARLKSVVHSADAHALVIISPVQEVLGSGFVPLEEGTSPGR